MVSSYYQTSLFYQKKIAKTKVIIKNSNKVFHNYCDERALKNGKLIES